MILLLIIGAASIAGLIIVANEYNNRAKNADAETLKASASEYQRHD